MAQRRVVPVVVHVVAREDTTQASTFFSDATNGTTSAMPEFIPGYNKGPSDFNARHNWVFNFTWQIPFRRRARRVARRTS